MNIASSYKGLERRIAKPSPVLLALSALGVAAIAYATLCPIGMRPHLASANEERFGAYFVLGLILALALKRRWMAVTGFMVVLAFVLEAGQLLVPGRDAVFADAVVKALGGVMGASTGHLFYPLKRALGRLAPKPAAPIETTDPAAL